MGKKDTVDLIDELHDDTKVWLHNTALIINDLGFYHSSKSDSEALFECIRSGLIVKVGAYIEIPSEVNEIVYSQQRLKEYV